MDEDLEIPSMAPSLAQLVNAVVAKVLDGHGAISSPANGAALIGQRESNYLLYVQVIVVREEDGPQVHEHMEKACNEFLDARYGKSMSLTLGPKDSKPQ